MDFTDVKFYKETKTNGGQGETTYKLLISSLIVVRLNFGYIRTRERQIN